MRSFREQFTLRGIVIGALGCALITASSLYTALKLGALPWPIFFVTLLALVALRLCARAGRATNINEVNVSATMMSAGAMVAGGIAFTVPGLFILQADAELPLALVLIAALAGVGLGVVGTALFRRRFIVEANLPYPIGTGAAQTLRASFEGGRNAVLLFASGAVSLAVAFVRDFFGLLPQLLFSWVRVPGVAFGVYCSPMALAMGFLIGLPAAVVWFAGALIGDFGVVVAGTAAGLWSTAEAAGIKMSLGIGVMIGCGVGVLLKVAGGFAGRFVPRSAGSQGARDNAGAQNAQGEARNTQETQSVHGSHGAQGEASGAHEAHSAHGSHGAQGEASGAHEAHSAHETCKTCEAHAHEAHNTREAHETRAQKNRKTRNEQTNTNKTELHIRPWWALVVAAVVAAVLALAGVVPPVAAVMLVVLVWLALLMAAQSTGQAGLNPMEVFGIIVLLVIALFLQLGTLEALLVAAVVTVACGFVGDMMNDFKAGHLLQTSPRAQWLAECMGGVVGAVVAALVMVLLIGAYGTSSFGPNQTFVAAQASAVAAMVGSIPSLPAFFTGLAVGCVLYLLRAPVITLGLGIYLPFYLSLTVAVGAALRFVAGRIAPQWVKGEKGTVLASGLLAGESIAGVLIALIVVATNLGG